MFTQKPFKNTDISEEFFLELSKVPHYYRDFFEIGIMQPGTLIINYPIKVIISLNEQLEILELDESVIIFSTNSIVSLFKNGKMSITL